MKLTIVGMREYSFPDRQDPDKLIEGKMYLAFTKSGKAIEFSSREYHEVHSDEDKFNPDTAEEVNIQQKLKDGGKIGYREVVEET